MHCDPKTGAVVPKHPVSGAQAASRNRRASKLVGSDALVGARNYSAIQGILEVRMALLEISRTKRPKNIRTICWNLGLTLQIALSAIRPERPNTKVTNSGA